MILRRIAVLALAALTVPESLLAQRRVRVSPGLALGTAVETFRPSSSVWTTGHHALATLDVEASGVPFRLRGEVMAVGLNQSHGPVSIGASLVLPVGRWRVRPYALAGGGVYGVGGVGHPVGWSSGVGAEYRRRTVTTFVEARRHTQTPTAVSLGLRF